MYLRNYYFQCVKYNYNRRKIVYFKKSYGENVAASLNIIGTYHWFYNYNYNYKINATSFILYLYILVCSWIHFYSFHPN